MLAIDHFGDDMKKFFKYLYYYAKCHKGINQLYNWSLKNGYARNDEAGWLERTDYWYKGL